MALDSFPEKGATNGSFLRNMVDRRWLKNPSFDTDIN